MKDKLNIGCGNNILPDYVNLDREKRPGVDVVHNLNDLPLPFHKNRFNVILASHIIEHVIDPYALMEDLYRILKPGGKIIVRLPSARRSSVGHLRVGHTKGYFDCLTHFNIGFDSKPLFKEIHVRGRKFDPGRTWFNFRDWILNNIFHEWEYVLFKDQEGNKK